MRRLIRLLRAPACRRPLAVALLALLVGSALLTPQYNPLTRGPVLGAAGVSEVWNELLQWRRAMVEARLAYDGWPDDIALFTPPLEQARLRVHSPQAYRLVAEVADDAALGDLAGTRIVLDFAERGDGWTCRAGEPPIPARYLPLSCRSGGDTADTPVASDLRMLTLICIALFVGAGVLVLVRHPLLGPSQLQPRSLLRLPLGRLPALDRLLGLLGRRRATLAAAGIAATDWQRALACAAAAPAERATALADALGARCRSSADWALPGAVFEWQFGTDLPVGLDRCLVYLPAPDLTEDEIVARLRAAQTGMDVMLVIAAPQPAAPGALAAHCADAANLLVLLDASGQSEWLLGGAAQDVLLRGLAAQLRVTRISPYQTRGGVVRAGAFFGRAQLLARVLNREPANYLVVGGRQLGKSSLLKAVQRRLEGHPHIACHYLSLRDHRLAPRLALQFGLKADTALEAVIDHLAASHAGKRLFLLIDEADLFFRDEAHHGYPQLSALRALSEEGRCWFMLAGFWDLYAAAVLDYQSPLRNFGEVLTIGGLERAACRELATVPLARLRLGFASDAVVDEIVDASGQRANLVAIVCQECLEALQPGERVIDARHLARALASPAVQDALAGWGRLCHDEAACRFDRIAVYHAAQHGGRTSLGALAGLLAGQGRIAPADALKRALARLQLAYVFAREHGGYRFAIPLFQRQFDADELALLLAQEIAGLPMARASAQDFQPL